jgi:hypothetical protein
VCEKVGCGSLTIVTNPSGRLSSSPWKMYKHLAPALLALALPLYFTFFYQQSAIIPSITVATMSGSFPYFWIPRYIP